MAPVRVHRRKGKETPTPLQPVHDILLSSLPKYSDLLGHARAIRQMTVPEKKSVILACRAQAIHSLSSTTLLASQIYAPVIKEVGMERARIFESKVLAMEDYITDPVFSSFLLDVSKSLPLSPMEIVKEKSSSWGKEISVCESEARPEQFDFRCWFDARFSNHPLLPGQPSNPQMANDIRSHLELWRSRMKGRVLFPRMSSKAISRSTVREYEAVIGVPDLTPDKGAGDFTQVHLERFREQTGIALGGGCEMRQKWYRHGLKPRTYFAQGGFHYHPSKYLQGPINDLVDCYVTVNHHSRLNPMRLRPSPSEYCRIYDLFCFTSNYHEHQNFLRNLAAFCEGVIVYIVDAVEGKLAVDLGALMWEYVWSNYRSPYSRERVIDIPEHRECYHWVASFLGVYGNLMTCTFPHGASLAYAVGSSAKVNVAGDDAHFLQIRGEEDQVTPFIRANGVVEKSKEFSTDEDGAVCLKRGLYQETDRLWQKEMIVWPSLVVTAACVKDAILPRQFGRLFDTRNSALLALGTEILRFLQSIFWFKPTSDLTLVYDFLLQLYKNVEFPLDGSLPQCGGRFTVPALPSSPEGLLDCPIRRTVGRCYRGMALLSERTGRYEGEVPSAFDLYANYSWRGRKTAAISYLEKMGYVESSIVKRMFFDDEGFDRLVKEFYDPDPLVYDFIVLSDIPDKFHNL